MGSSCLPLSKNNDAIILPNSPSKNIESRTLRFATEEIDPIEINYREKWVQIRSYQKLNRKVLCSFERILSRNINGFTKFSKFTTQTGKSKIYNTVVDNCSGNDNDSYLEDSKYEIKQQLNLKKDQVISSFSQIQKPKEISTTKIQVKDRSSRLLNDKKLTVMSEIEEKFEESVKNSSASAIGTQNNPYPSNSNHSRESKLTKFQETQKSREYCTSKILQRKLSESAEKMTLRKEGNRPKFRSKSVNPTQDQQTKSKALDIKRHFKAGRKEILIN